MMVKNRKALLHTLEATIGFLMVTGFLVFVMPHLNSAQEKTENTRAYVYDGLSGMDGAGILRNLAANENLSGIKSELNDTLRIPLKFTVGLSKSNISHGTINPAIGAPAYINYTANKSALDSAVVSLEYINATSPSVYLNSTLLIRHSGNYSGNTETLDITQATQNGNNSIMMNTTNDAEISYSLMLVESIILETPPNNTNVMTVGYILSGNETVFSPKEVTVYVWD